MNLYEFYFFFRLLYVLESFHSTSGGSFRVVLFIWLIADAYVNIIVLMFKNKSKEIALSHSRLEHDLLDSFWIFF